MSGGEVHDGHTDGRWADLRAAHAAIWVEDDLTGWPEWEAVTGPYTDVSTGKVFDASAICWPDGDGIADVYSHCMHAHGTAADLARYLGACTPEVIGGLLDALDAAVARANAAERTLRVARAVVEMWRDAVMESDQTRAMAHPLAMVLTALDGATDPTDCGIGPDGYDDFTAALEAPR